MKTVLKRFTVILVAVLIMVVFTFIPSMAAKKLKILKPSQDKLCINDTLKLKTNYGKGVVWKSSNTTIATINKKTGKIKAKNRGKVKFTAIYKKQKASRTFNVVNSDEWNKEYLMNLLYDGGYVNGGGDPVIQIDDDDPDEGRKSFTNVSYDESTDKLKFYYSIESDHNNYRFETSVSMTIRMGYVYTAKVEINDIDETQEKFMNSYLYFDIRDYAESIRYNWSTNDTAASFLRTGTEMNEFSNSDLRYAINSWNLLLKTTAKMSLNDIGFDKLDIN